MLLRLLAIACFVSLVLPAPGQAALHVRIVDAETILAGVDRGDVFQSEAGRRIALTLDANDPSITNPSRAGRFFPVEASVVADVVQAMRPVPGPALDVVVYCLPGLPTDIGRSFAVGNEIFMAPGIGPLSDNVTAYTVVHELGHVVQHALLPHGSPSFQRYMQVRDLDTSHFHQGAAHRDRPSEIFAEDFRVFFGGQDATYSGTIENPHILHPSAVAGLQAFLERALSGMAPAPAIAAVKNFPNPFNPRTSIRVELAPELVHSGAPIEVEIFDARGREVRVLRASATASEVHLAWDGRDTAGQAVASGRYLYRVNVAGEQATGRMLLLK